MKKNKKNIYVSLCCIELIIIFLFTFNIFTKKIKINEIESKENNYVFNNIFEMKSSDLKVRDIVKTEGYYSKGDGGGAVYIIEDYNYYLNTWLPVDCRKVSYKFNRLGTDKLLMDTPVDEHGNHTLENGLVACLYDKENIKAEQYGAIGDGNFDNSEVFIHLFAHMKKGTIEFKKDAVYLIAQRDIENIDDIYSENGLDNPYRAYMTGRGASMSKPIMANIDGVNIIGDNSTLKIKDNDWCNSSGVTDMGLLNLMGFIKNLKIDGIIFDSNGLTMDETHVLSNHGIFYKSGNRTGENELPYKDVEFEFSNIEITNCEFRNGGTSADVNDCGGDGILIIDPPALSYNINIHDNKFTNWGRWAFAIDLGGNGERIDGLKFNNNICIQDDKNSNASEKYRGLGWIDFESKKCCSNLEIKNNDVSGLNGFAINGAGEVTENVIILGNTIIRPDRNYKSAYPYMFNFYGVQIKDLIFEENDICKGTNRFGYTSNNITIKNNKLRESIQIHGLYGDIIVEKNSMENKGCIISIESLDIPTYISKEERIYCNFKFINNNGGIKGKIFDEDAPGKCSYIDITIANNKMNYMNFEAWDDSDFTFNPKQISENIDSFSCRGARFINNTSYNYRNIPKGGGKYNEGDIIINNSDKSLICTQSGYVPMQGAFKLAESDIKFTPNLSVKKGQYIYNDSYLYIACNDGMLGNELSHNEGTKLCGDVYMLKLADLAKFK